MGTTDTAGSLDRKPPCRDQVDLPQVEAGSVRVEVPNPDTGRALWVTWAAALRGLVDDRSPAASRVVELLRPLTCL
jgi:hypothetical protein